MSARRLAAVAALAAAALVTVTGCSGDDSLPKQWQDSSDLGFVSGDGTTTSFAPEARTEPVEFSGVSEYGADLAAEDFRGSVTVVNFWYAACAPCRAEAPDLRAAHEEFADQGVEFIGVNTRDGSAVAVQFAEQYGIEYPSILDTEGDRAVQRAFAGEVPLNAVPTTLVLDTEGRVAHRVLGMIADVSQLRTLINETLAEGAAA